MNSIYHTELLAPSTVPFPVYGKIPLNVLSFSYELEVLLATKDDQKYKLDAENV